MSARIDRGSARVSRADNGVLPVADLFFTMQSAPRDSFIIKDCFGVMPKPARETRALPNPSP
ncbi:MAG: hypothetical protein DME60_02215 [Verrucomicrobia bacterium]|nr:MAG: hypothetical protein DME60_02215 [Verrucomicrobiota bacterium]